MLVFFTNISLMEFQVGYLALFGYMWFWAVLCGKSSQEYPVIAGVPQRFILFLYFSCYTLMTFLMILFIILLLMLMILLCTLNVVRRLIRGSN